LLSSKLGQEEQRANNVSSDGSTKREAKQVVSFSCTSNHPANVPGPPPASRTSHTGTGKQRSGAHDSARGSNDEVSSVVGSNYCRQKSPGNEALSAVMTPQQHPHEQQQQHPQHPQGSSPMKQLSSTPKNVAVTSSRSSAAAATFPAPSSSSRGRTREARGRSLRRNDSSGDTGAHVVVDKGTGKQTRGRGISSHRRRTTKQTSKSPTASTSPMRSPADVPGISRTSKRQVGQVVCHPAPMTQQVQLQQQQLHYQQNYQQAQKPSQQNPPPRQQHARSAPLPNQRQHPRSAKDNKNRQMPSSSSSSHLDVLDDSIMRVDTICNQICNYLQELDDVQKPKYQHHPTRGPLALVKVEGEDRSSSRRSRSKSGRHANANESGSSAMSDRLCRSESDRMGIGSRALSERINGRIRRSETFRLNNASSLSSSIGPSSESKLASSSYFRKSSLPSSLPSHYLPGYTGIKRPVQINDTSIPLTRDATARNPSNHKEVTPSSPIHSMRRGKSPYNRRGADREKSRQRKKSSSSSSLTRIPSPIGLIKRLPSKEGASSEMSISTRSCSTATVSLSKSESSVVGEECNTSILSPIPIESVMRSYHDPSHHSPPDKTNGRGEGKTRRGRSLGSRNRYYNPRRSSSLSRNAVRALTTLSIPTLSPEKEQREQDLLLQKQYSSLESDDSKASMVYDVPFDPFTGNCNYHPGVCMAVRAKTDGEEGRVGVTGAATVVGGWKIIRTKCPKCMYNC